MLSRRTIAALTTAGAVAVVTIGGSAIASGGPTDAPVAVASPQAPLAPIGAVEPDQAAAFAVLRRPRVASDAIPADIAAAVASPGKFGRNPELSRAVRTSTGKGWVVPGRGFLCIVAPASADGYGTSCLPTQVAVDEGLTLQLVEPDESSSTSLLPDGARAVVAQEDDTAVALRKDASGVAVTDTTDAERVTVITEEGRTTTPVPEPDGTVTPTG